MIEAPAPCELVPAPASPATTTTLARAWLDAMNAHDLAGLRALLADEFTWSGAAPSCGAAEALCTWQRWFAATPDLAFAPVRELGDAAWAILQLRVRATARDAPSAVFTPRPGASLPRLCTIDLPGCAVLALRSGHVTHLWTYWDEATLTRAGPARPAHADF